MTRRWYMVVAAMEPSANIDAGGVRLTCSPEMGIGARAHFTASVDTSKGDSLQHSFELTVAHMAAPAAWRPAAVPAL